jgi:hypothetical protein
MHKGAKRDPDAELQRYIEYADEAGDQLYNQMEQADSVRDYLRKELQALKDDLSLRNTPLNSSVVSLASQPLQEWIDTK